MNSHDNNNGGKDNTDNNFSLRDQGETRRHSEGTQRLSFPHNKTTKEKKQITTNLGAGCTLSYWSQVFKNVHSLLVRCG